MAKGKGKKKRSAKGQVAGGGLGGTATKAAKKLLGKDGEEKKRRSRGPSYWANKVIVEKLKKKYKALKYGSIR